jgi:hypothetical protein
VIRGFPKSSSPTSSILSLCTGKRTPMIGMRGRRTYANGLMKRSEQVCVRLEQPSTRPPYQSPCKRHFAMEEAGHWSRRRLRLRPVLPQQRTSRCVITNSALGPTAEVVFSLDHLVGEREKRRRDREAERRSLGSPHGLAPRIPALHEPKNVFRPTGGVNWPSHSGATAWSASGSTDGAQLT